MPELVGTLGELLGEQGLQAWGACEGCTACRHALHSGNLLLDVGCLPLWFLFVKLYFVTVRLDNPQSS